MEGVNSFYSNIIIGLLVYIITYSAERLFFIYFKNSELVNYVRKFKLVLIHIIVSYLSWHFFNNYASIQSIPVSGQPVNPIIIFIIVLNIFIWISRLKYSQVNGVKLIKRKGKDENEIEIHKLKLDSKKYKLRITWETFGKGIEILTKTLREASGVQPNIIYGVNESGIIIASYLSAKLPNRCPLGIIKTGAKDKDGQKEFFQFDHPDKIKKPKCIAVVDSEVKSGKTTKNIINCLKDKFKDSNPEIFYIALVGINNSDKIDSVRNFGWHINEETEEEYKPDFLAFYIKNPGYEPPGGIK